MLAIEDAVREFDRAEGALASCLAAAGFDYTRAAIRIDVVETGLPTASASKRRFGYGIVNGEGNSGWTGWMTPGEVPTEQQAAHQAATAPGGVCGDQVNVYDASAAAQALQRDRSELTAVQMTDRLMVAARKEWASCMASMGYPYRSPEEAFQLLNEEFNDLGSKEAVEAFATKELAIAAADADCYDIWIAPTAMALTGP